MTQIPAVQSYPIPQANYNAVKIDIHNPTVAGPGNQQFSQQEMPAQAPVTAPIYNVPTASIYEVPKTSVYGSNNENFNVPPTAKETPSVPAPVIVNPTVSAPVEQKVEAPAKAEAAPAPVEANAPEAPAQNVEVKAPEAAAPQVDLNAFLARLTNENFDEQANAMESIAELAQSSPAKATELLDTKVFDALLAILGKDSSKLAGPTPKQLEIREKIMNNQQVTDAEKAEANVITPMEQAERNKQYAMYTAAILQKLYGNEIQKMNNTTVPLTELPGIAGIVEQVKNNPNPMVRASGIDALSYIQAPDYKQDLSTIFTIAQKDKDANVQQAATKAIEKLAQVPAPAAAPSPAAPAAEAPKAAA